MSASRFTVDSFAPNPLRRIAAQEPASPAPALLHATSDFPPDPASEALACLEAARRGDGACLSLLLHRGANPHALDPEGNTLLHLATGSGDARCIRLALSRGITPQQRNALDETPDSYARRLGAERSERGAAAFLGAERLGSPVHKRERRGGRGRALAKAQSARSIAELMEVMRAALGSARKDWGDSLELSAQSAHAWLSCSFIVGVPRQGWTPYLYQSDIPPQEPDPWVDPQATERATLAAAKGIAQALLAPQTQQDAAQSQWRRASESLGASFLRELGLRLAPEAASLAFGDRFSERPPQGLSPWVPYPTASWAQLDARLSGSAHWNHLDQGSCHGWPMGFQSDERMANAHQVADRFGLREVRVGTQQAMGASAARLARMGEALGRMARRAGLLDEHMGLDGLALIAGSHFPNDLMGYQHELTHSLALRESHFSCVPVRASSEALLGHEWTHALENWVAIGPSGALARQRMTQARQAIERCPPDPRLMRQWQRAPVLESWREACKALSEHPARGEPPSFRAGSLRWRIEARKALGMGSQSLYQWLAPQLSASPLGALTQLGEFSEALCLKWAREQQEMALRQRDSRQRPQASVFLREAQRQSRATGETYWIARSELLARSSETFFGGARTDNVRDSQSIFLVPHQAEASYIHQSFKRLLKACADQLRLQQATRARKTTRSHSQGR